MNQAIDTLHMLDAAIAKNKATLLERHYKKLYPWQRTFIENTKTHTSCMLMAANQVGKSRTGCIIDAYHLRGDYPEDWPGYKFEFPPLIWVLGYSGEKTRDLLQKKLFGKLDTARKEFSGGYIPKERILSYISMTSVSGACREVTVQHENGTATCQFWSYTQGQEALMGDVVDLFHIDEEPEDGEIYPQVVTRTLNGDRGMGGRGLLTFTPEHGRTELVCQFQDEPSSSDYLQTVTWDECPHMSEEKKEAFLSKYPPYQRDMRSKGVPLMGSGLIYPVDTDKLKCDPFTPPAHWFIINGIDFGWDHPQAHIQLVWDRDADMMYITNAWKKSEKQPYEAWHIVKPWAEDIPYGWPNDGLQHKVQSSGEAVKMKDLYEEAGAWFLEDKAEFEDGGDGVWVGIMQLLNYMSTGRLKIFSNLTEVIEEILHYHTKTLSSGKIEIVKVKDDLLDALRYAYMMRRHAIRIGDIGMDYTWAPQESGREEGAGY